MSADQAANYEEFIIESNDGSRDVDLRFGVISFQYFEDVFSPTVTARVLVQSSGGGDIEDFKGVGGTKALLQGLPIIGGERVSIKVKTVVGDGIDLTSDPLYVGGVSEIMSDGDREVFTLNLVSRSAITNETSRVTKKYPTTQKIDISVKQIAEEFLKIELPEDNIDSCKNQYGFIGNLRKPFTVLTWLAGKAIPASGKKDSTAGYFFYQTLDGHYFKSIDELIKQEPYAEYKEDTVQKNALESGVEETATKIMSYTFKQNTNILEKLRTGAFSSHNVFFDPLTFEFPQFTYKLKEFAEQMEVMGEPPELPPIEAGSSESLGDYPTRLMTRILDRGTMDPDVKVDVNSDPAKVQSQSIARYNLLMTQAVQVTVACNSDLRVGMIVKLFFKNQSFEKGNEFDEHTSGLYMIKELCHQFTQRDSLTSMLLVRDSYGRK
jgi:hypothetical protein